MVSKNGSQLRDSRFVLSDSDLARQIGAALREELGATRRATKTVMRWTGVSDTTARAWLQGRASPSGIHLVALAAHSDPVMIVLLRLTGHGDLELGLRLREIEVGLVQLLALVRETQSRE
ncbi:hypothetical protein [Sphingobium tyrosinilyticum]|uniref:XRE family transcriptional regulator n=1 Tax=Sphingobium tyrosinilyticum TaxID=2715436 RepID=A0ABV9F0X6_9SPHN